MKKLNIRRSGAIFLLMVLCAWEEVSSAEVPFTISYESTDPSGLNQVKNEKSTTSDYAEKILVKAQHPALATKSTPNRENSENAKKLESDKSLGNTEILSVGRRGSGPGFNFFNPFLPFSFFPFPLPNRKKSSHAGSNLSDERDKDAGNSFLHKPEPLFLIDFAFDIREVPVNKTVEFNLSGKDGAARVAPKKGFSKISKDSGFSQKIVASDISESDWSFLEDPFLMPPDMDEFLPKSDLLLFDFPFHKAPPRRLQKRKSDAYKPVAKSDLNFIIDIFDEALSRTKKEMQRSIPFWNIMRNRPKDYSPEGRAGKANFLSRLHQMNRIKMHEQEKSPEKQLNERKAAKRNSSKQHKSPFIMGKVVKIDEIHVDENSPKNNAKRRTSSAPGNKVNRGIQETSIELLRMDEPLKENIATKLEDLTPQQTNLNDVTFKIHSEVIADEESTQNKGGTSPEESDEESKFIRQFLPLPEDMKRDAGALEERKPLLEMFKTVADRKAGAPDPKEGFRFVSHVPKLSTSGGDTSVNDRESNDSRAEANLTKEYSKSYNGQDKDQLVEPNLREGTWDAFDRERRQINRRKEESQQVADLNNLFLTVTLPTMFAFTILLLICFFNLQVKGWLCMRVFKTREVSILDQDAECNQIMKERIHHQT